MPAFLAAEFGIADDGVDLAHAGADVVAGRAHGTGHKAARTVQLNPAADFLTNERIQINVGRLACAQVQGVRGLEEQLVRKQAVEALVASEPNRLKNWSTKKNRNGFAADGQRTGGLKIWNGGHGAPMD